MRFFKPFGHDILPVSHHVHCGRLAGGITATAVTDKHIFSITGVAPWIWHSASRFPLGQPAPHCVSAGMRFAQHSFVNRALPSTNEQRSTSTTPTTPTHCRHLVIPTTPTPHHHRYHTNNADAKAPPTATTGQTQHQNSNTLT